MGFRLLNRRTALAALCVAFSPLVCAQSPIKIADALAQAWARHPASQSAAVRAEEIVARQSAAASLTPSPPTLALSQLSDARFANLGRRATEAELSIPIWNWGARDAAQASASAEGGAIEAQLVVTKLKLSGEVREGLWALATARVEETVAKRKVSDAQALGEDVARRVAAGDLAPVDANLAQSALRLAQLNAAQAREATLRAELIVQSLIGNADVAPIGEMPAQAVSVENHPNVRNAERARAAAQSRVASARAEQREGPTLTFTVSREKTSVDAAVEKALRIGVSIPLFANREGGVRVASANAELAEASALAQQSRAQAQAELQLSQRSIEIATEISTAANARAEFARETQALYTKSFQLGESDLPTRLRAEAERFEAERAAERARVEVLRAISRLNQSYGVIP